MDKPIYLGFTVVKFSKLLMYETYYDTLQPYFGQENLQLHYMDTDSFVPSIKTKNITHDLLNLIDSFDFSNLNVTHELFNNENKKVVGKFKIETPENIWIDEFVCLRSKSYSFKFGRNNTNKLKVISKSQAKDIKFEEYYYFLFGGEYRQECDNYVIRSVNHDMYLQKASQILLSSFDEKRCYENENENRPWN